MLGRSKFVYVDNITNSVARAKERAGDRDIGTAGAAQLALDAGLVDEIWLHVAPIALGKGRSLFADRVVTMTTIDSIAGPGATHVRFRVER